jgi:hypothetical protein
LIAHLAARGDQGERVGGASRAALVTDEQPCLATEHPRTNVAFDFVVGQLHERVAKKRGEPWPLPVQVADRLAQRRLGLDLATAPVDPGVKLIDKGSAVAKAPLPALLEGFTEAFGLGVDVEDLGVELEPLDRARIAVANGLDQTASAVRVAATAPAADPLDAVVGGRAVAHHTAEGVPLEELLEVLGVSTRRIQKARVAVIALEEPERAALDAQRVGPIEHRHARGVERGEARGQSALADMSDDRVEQIDHLADRRSERVGRQRHVLLAGVSLHALEGHGVLVVIDQRLHQKLVAENATVDGFVGRVGRHNVIAARTGARLDLGLRHDERQGTHVELFGGGLDGDALGLHVTVRTRALGVVDEKHVGHPRQVGGQLGSAVRGRFFSAALFGLLVLGRCRLAVIGRRRDPKGQLHLQPAHRLIRRAFARRARELLHQLRVEIAHSHQQRDDRRHQPGDRALGDHVRDELLDGFEVRSERAGDRRGLVARGAHRKWPFARSQISMKSTFERAIADRSYKVRSRLTRASLPLRAASAATIARAAPNRASRCPRAQATTPRLR